MAITPSGNDPTGPWKPKSKTPIAPMGQHFSTAAPKQEDPWGNRFGPGLSLEEKRWKAFAETPVNGLGDLGAKIAGVGTGILRDAMIAFSGDEARKAVHFGIPFGSEAWNGRFNNTDLTTAAQYAKSDTAFANQFKAMGLSV